MLIIKSKNIPLRKCIICSDRKEKRELVRVVKNKEGDVFVDLTGKSNGRGAYLCRSEECIQKAVKNNRLNNALKTKVPISVFETLKEEIKNG